MQKFYIVLIQILFYSKVVYPISNISPQSYNQKLPYGFREIQINDLIKYKLNSSPYNEIIEPNEKLINIIQSYPILTTQIVLSYYIFINCFLENILPISIRPNLRKQILLLVIVSKGIDVIMSLQELSSNIIEDSLFPR